MRPLYVRRLSRRRVLVFYFSACDPSTTCPLRPSWSTWTCSSATSRAWPSARAQHGVRLRPHAKTHKIVAIGRHAARGGRHRALRREDERGRGVRRRGLRRPLRRLSGRGPGQGPPAPRASRTASAWRSACDSVEGARTLAPPFAAAGRTLDVMLKVDVGFHRVGVRAGRARLRSRRIAGAARPAPARHLHACRPGLRARRLRTPSTRWRRTRAGRWPLVAEAIRARRARRSRRSPSAPPRPRATPWRSPASPSAGPATTSSTTPRRSRSAPAASRTAR